MASRRNLSKGLDGDWAHLFRPIPPHHGGANNHVTSYENWIFTLASTESLKWQYLLNLPRIMLIMIPNLVTVLEIVTPCPTVRDHQPLCEPLEKSPPHSKPTFLGHGQSWEFNHYSSLWAATLPLYEISIFQPLTITHRPIIRIKELDWPPSSMMVGNGPSLLLPSFQVCIFARPAELSGTAPGLLWWMPCVLPPHLMLGWRAAAQTLLVSYIVACSNELVHQSCWNNGGLTKPSDCCIIRRGSSV